MIKIGYRIGGSFEDYCKDGNVGFEILFPHIYSSFDRRLRNATSRINTAFFVTYKQITPHRIWYNRVD